MLTLIYSYACYSVYRALSRIKTLFTVPGDSAQSYLKEVHAGLNCDCTNTHRVHHIKSSNKFMIIKIWEKL